MYISGMYTWITEVCNIKIAYKNCSGIITTSACLWHSFLFQMHNEFAIAYPTNFLCYTYVWYILASPFSTFFMCTPAHTHICTYTYVCTHIRIQTHIHTHTDTHRHTHTYVHMFINTPYTYVHVNTSLLINLDAVLLASTTTYVCKAVQNIHNFITNATEHLLFRY